MARVPVLLNRGGGAFTLDPQLRKKVAAALKAAGVEAKIELIDGGDCEVRARTIAERGDELLIVGGGDGTIGAAASALAGTATRLGVLPLGTLNHFARDIGIPLDLGQAALAIAQGREQRVDVAELRAPGDPPQVFVNNSAIGLYPLMVLDRDAQQRTLGRSKWLAMTVAALRTFIRFKHQRLALTVNDRKARIETPLLFVGNNDYRLELPGAGTRESLSDGQLCVMVLRKGSRLGLFATIARALMGRARADDMIKLDSVETLRVDSHKSRFTVSLDGETRHVSTPLDYCIRKQALTVMVPPAKGPDAA